jgi:hypothetical protein
VATDDAGGALLAAAGPALVGAVPAVEPHAAAVNAASRTNPLNGKRLPIDRAGRSMSDRS